MASLDNTIAGRVFLISTPSVGSRLTKTTSPRRTSTTRLLLFQDAPGLRIARFPISQQVFVFLDFLIRAIRVIRRVFALQLLLCNGIKESGQHLGNDLA